MYSTPEDKQVSGVPAPSSSLLLLLLFYRFFGKKTNDDTVFLQPTGIPSERAPEAAFALEYIDSRQFSPYYYKYGGCFLLY
jgi:hypothetical protein